MTYDDDAGKEVKSDIRRVVPHVAALSPSVSPCAIQRKKLHCAACHAAICRFALSQLSLDFLHTMISVMGLRRRGKWSVWLIARCWSGIVERTASIALLM